MPTPNTDVNLGVGNVDIIYAIQNLLSGNYVVTSKTNVSTATILNGGTTSNAITMSGNSLVGLSIPSTWEGGNITIMGCDTEGGTYLDLYDSAGTIVTATVGGTNRIVALTSTHLQAIANLPFIKLKSASSVGADRVIKVILKG